jgi:hypothetical protein
VREAGRLDSHFLKRLLWPRTCDAFFYDKKTLGVTREVVDGGTAREESRFERSVAVGGAQVENQITEIAVDGELRLERPAEKKRSLSLTDRALPQDASKDAEI